MEGLPWWWMKVFPIKVLKISASWSLQPAELRIHGEVLRILNSVDHMISNVHYVYPGMMCQENTFAYVSARLEALMWGGLDLHGMKLHQHRPQTSPKSFKQLCRMFSFCFTLCFASSPLASCASRPSQRQGHWNQACHMHAKLDVQVGQGTRPGQPCHICAPPDPLLTLSAPLLLSTVSLPSGGDGGQFFLFSRGSPYIQACGSIHPVGCWGTREEASVRQANWENMPAEWPRIQIVSCSTCTWSSVLLCVGMCGVFVVLCSMCTRVFSRWGTGEMWNLRSDLQQWFEIKNQHLLFQGYIFSLQFTGRNARDLLVAGFRTCFMLAAVIEKDDPVWWADCGYIWTGCFNHYLLYNVGNLLKFLRKGLIYFILVQVGEHHHSPQITSYHVTVYYSLIDPGGFLLPSDRGVLSTSNAHRSGAEIVWVWIGLSIWNQFK